MDINEDLTHMLRSDSLHPGLSHVTVNDRHSIFHQMQGKVMSLPDGDKVEVRLYINKAGRVFWDEKTVILSRYQLVRDSGY